MLEILLSPRSRYRIDVESQCQCNEYDYDVEWGCHSQFFDDIERVRRQDAFFFSSLVILNLL